MQVYIETPRDAYEAYVIYSFYSLMVESLGSRAALAEILEARGGIASVIWPFCCIKWRMGYEFLTNTSIGVFQYVFLRLACTVITFITEYFGMYNDVSSGLCFYYLYHGITSVLRGVYLL